MEEIKHFYKQKRCMSFMIDVAVLLVIWRGIFLAPFLLLAASKRRSGSLCHLHRFDKVCSILPFQIPVTQTGAQDEFLVLQETGAQAVPQVHQGVDALRLSGRRNPTVST